MRLINADALIQSLEKKHEHWHELVPEENKEIEFAHSYALNVIRNAPTVDAKPTGELISRADAIELLTEIVFDEPPYFDSETLCRLYAEEQINTLPSAEIAETEPIVIRCRTLLPTKDFREWAKRIREVNPNAVVIPCDAEVASADAVQGYTEWLEKIIVDAETFEWLCEDTNDKEWCEDNCHYSSIQAECLRHLYEAIQRR